MDAKWATNQNILEIYSKSQPPAMAKQGAGDVARGCRLCGEPALRRVSDPLALDGREDRCDRLLEECFGVKVRPTECLICERCVQQLRKTHKFRAQVCAAFDKLSSNSSTTSIELASYVALPKTRRFLHNLKPLEDLPRPKPKKPERKMVKNIEVKKKILACHVCKQRYPMMGTDSGMQFICSRCKLKQTGKTGYCKKCNIPLPADMMQDHWELHAKADLRGKTRLSNQVKKSAQVKKTESTPKTKRLQYACSLCPNIYLGSHNLALHVKSVHGQKDFTCYVCKQNLKTKELLDKHLKQHTGQRIFECDVCKRNFKEKSLLEKHYLIHVDVKSASFSLVG